MSPTEVATPEQLLHALEVQSRMPILRIGPVSYTHLTLPTNREV